VRLRAAAVSLCVLAAAGCAVHAGGSSPGVWLLGLGAVAVLATGLTLRRSSAIVVSSLLLVAAYAWGSAAGATGGVDVAAPLYGVCLLGMAELGFLAVGIPMLAQADPRALSRYARSLALVALAALVMGELFAIVAGVTEPGSRLLFLAGAAAAVVSVAVVTRLALGLTRVSARPAERGSSFG
jgi:hypothetical protein